MSSQNRRTVFVLFLAPRVIVYIHRLIRSRERGACFLHSVVFLALFFCAFFLLSDGNNNALLRIHCLQRRRRTPRTMASVAEQNALRYKEAGNALYKSERYEEVRRCGFARIIFFSSRRHVSFSFSLSKRFPIRVYENAHISNHLCRLTTGVSSLFSLSLRARVRVCATGHRKIYGIHSIGRYEPGRVHQPSGGTFQSQTFLPSASRLGNEHDLGRKVDERVLSQSEMFTRDER